MLSVRQACPNDTDIIMTIFARAKKFMAEEGNPNQWGGAYPERHRIEEDIEAGVCHVVTDEAGKIVGTFCLIIGPDPTYNHIIGQWPDSSPYGTIHRIASAGTHKGVADCALEYCLSKINTIRIDTHADNRPMLNWITRSGFSHCGTIFTHDGSPRLAFHLSKHQI